MTPVTPKPARSFRLLSHLTDCINSSLLIVQPNDAEGNVPIYDQRVVTVGITIAHTTEEAYKFVVILVTAHACLSKFEKLSQSEIVLLIEVTHKICIVGIEAFIHIILVAISSQRLQAMVSKLMLISGCKFKVVMLTIRITMIGISRMVVDYLVIMP